MKTGLEFYAIAQEIHGKLAILSELKEDDIITPEVARENAKAVAQKGRPIYVIKVQILEGWIG